MNNRELSKDPAIRQISHFEGYLSSQDFNSMIARIIPNDDIEIMKKISYRILEFGQFNWNQVITAFKVYKSYYGDLNIKDDYIINDEILDLNIGYDDDIEGMLLGEALKSIRIGDIDGLEDVERRKQLDELGFDWGDKKLYQRYRFVPMLLGKMIMINVVVMMINIFMIMMMMEMMIIENMIIENIIIEMMIIERMMIELR